MSYAAFVTVLLSVQALSLAMPAWIHAEARNGDTVGPVVLVQGNDGVLRGRWVGGLVEMVATVEGFQVTFDGSAVTPPGDDLLGSAFVSGTYSVVPLSVEWIGFDVSTIAAWCGAGMSIAFVLHMGSIMIGWFAGDFLDTIGHGMTK